MSVGSKQESEDMQVDTPVQSSSTYTINSQENGVTWIWYPHLCIYLNTDRVKNFKVLPHPIHNSSYYVTASLKGNHFYGSFTILTGTQIIYKGMEPDKKAPIVEEDYIYANPTKDDHTEPQYFAWLENKLAEVNVNVEALILEINQTNTPCSGEGCRPAILKCIKEGVVGKVKYPIVIARMAAFQIYETQPPKVGITSFQIKALQKKQKSSQKADPLHVKGSCAVHRVPDGMSLI